MTRPLDPATATALDGSSIPMAAIVSLDVEGDPLYAWTGIGDIFFGAPPELIVNGDGGSLTGWNGAGSSLVGGRLRLTNIAPYHRIYQNVTLVPGQTYRIKADIYQGTTVSSPFTQLWVASDTNGGSIDKVFGVGVGQNDTFVATISNAFIVLVIYDATVGVYAEFDNISIKAEITDALAATGDPSLDGKTFKGLGEVAEISGVSEGVGGSDSLELNLPGVSIDDPMMRQLIRDKRLWQFRRAIVWLMVLNPNTMAIAGKPFRIKTGRMDAMPYTEGRGRGIIKVSIEGQQAYGDHPLNSRYSEQIDIVAADTSQKYVYSLANMTPEFGKNTSVALNTLAGGSVGGGGGSPISRATGGILGYFRSLVENRAAQ